MPEYLSQNHLMRSLLDNAPVFVWATQVNSGATYFNKTYLNFVGKTFEEMSGDGYMEVTHPDETELIEAVRQHCRTSPSTLEFEMRILRADGQFRTVHFSCQPHFDINQNFVGFIGYGFDISEERRVQESLRENQAKVKKLVDANILGVCTFNMDGSIEDANQAFLELLEYTAEDLAAGKVRWDIFADMDPHSNEELRKHGQIGTHERSLRTKNGKIITVLTAGTLLPDSKDRGIGYILDVTQLKNFEAELARAKSKAEQANQTKSDFLAYLSHEIRTPLNAILGISELLLRSPLPAEHLRNIELVYDSSTSLLRILNDVLDLSRIEAGKFDLELKPADIRNLIANVTDVFLPRAREKHLEIHAAVSERVAQEHVTDASRIRQILLNLVNNAIKFTPKGRILIRADIGSHSYDSTSQNIRITVEDTGIGIPSDKINKLFQPFSDLRQHPSSEQRGSGLGLSICKRLVERMGGTMGLSSKINEGSIFWFELPLKINEVSSRNFKKRGRFTISNVRAVSPILSKQEGSVLVVEDDLINQQVVKKQLEQLGLSFDVVSDGLEALKYLESKIPDLILMDCQMPQLSGIETTRRIRSLSINFVPIIGITANASEEQTIECLEEGMDDVLHKPLQLVSLREKISKWIRCKTIAGRYVDKAIVDRDLIELFDRTAQQRLQKMDEAFSISQYETIASTAHAMISSCGTLGLPRLAGLSRAIERRARLGDREGVERDLKLFKVEYQSIRNRLFNPSSAPEKPTNHMLGHP